MSPKIKHLAVYAFIIAAGFFAAWFFLPHENELNVPAVENTPPAKDSLIEADLLTEHFDLENAADAWASGEKAVSGKISCRLQPEIEFGVSIRKKISDLPNYAGLQSLLINYKCFAAADPDALFVLVVEDPKGKNLFWDGKPVRFEKMNSWCDGQAEFSIAPELLVPDNIIAVYPWNRNKKVFFVDDIHLTYKGRIRFQSSITASNTNLFFDFESADGISGAETIKKTTAHSGSMACDLSDGREFGPSVSKKIAEFGGGAISKVSVSAWFYPLSDGPNTVITASSIKPGGEAIFWEGKSTDCCSFPKNTWTKLNASFHVPAEKLGPNDLLNVGIWNKGKSAVIIDDLEIVYGEAPERKGEPSDLDENTIYNGTYRPRSNRPPYQTIWLQKQDIGNSNTRSITPPLKGERTELSPNDLFFVGNFMDAADGLDELLWVSDEKQMLFAYDQQKTQFKKIWENKNTSDPLWSRTNVYTVVEKAGSSQLNINKCGEPAIPYRFDGRNWILASEKILIPCYTPAEGKPFQKFSGNFSSDKEQSLIYDQTLRFDLKLTENDIVIGNVDFKGYPADNNPKYYEYVRILTGRFVNPKRSSVLVIMANCADADFKGQNCKKLDDLNYLPNRTELYTFRE